MSISKEEPLSKQVALTDGEEEPEDPRAEPEVTTEEEEEEAKDFPLDDGELEAEENEDNQDNENPEEPALQFLKHPSGRLNSDEWGLEEKDDGKDGSDDQYDQLDDDYDDDDDDDLLEPKPSQSMLSLHISSLEVTTRQEAEIIAEEVIRLLEEDVVIRSRKEGIDLLHWSLIEPSKNEEPLFDDTPREKFSGSSLSVSSNISITLPGEPSKVRMFYEKGITDLRAEAIHHIQHGHGKDEICEAALHRSRKFRHGRPGHDDKEAQTKTMTFLSEANAQMAFMEMYPKPDDYVTPEIHARQASLDAVVDAAERENPLVDMDRLGPQIIKFSNRKKLLQPLRDDYYKDETFWTGSRFRGEYRNRQFYKGNYDHPTGVKYESEWKDGHFHSTNHFGVMVYPRGDTFEGQWYKGRYISGKITFGDGLEYSSSNWQYCEPPDRRLRIERYLGVKAAGSTIFNDQYPMQKLPPGCYDVGDGIYNPKTGEVRGFDGFLIRKVTVKEHEWIKQYCRKSPTPEEEYVPTFSPDRIPGANMELLHRFNVAKRHTH